MEQQIAFQSAACGVGEDACKTASEKGGEWLERSSRSTARLKQLNRALCRWGKRVMIWERGVPLFLTLFCVRRAGVPHLGRNGPGRNLMMPCWVVSLS